jgi:hypothetical protein
MRKLMLSMLLVAAVPASAAAQGMWQSEIGIRGGFSSVDFTDLDATMTLWDIPGAGGISGLGAIYIADAPLYAVIPMGDRMAIVPTFGFQSLSAGTQITSVAAGVRLNYAVNENFYFGAGPTAYIVKADGFEDTQGAFEAAFGYRRAIGSQMRFHAEAFYQAREQSEAIPQANVMGLRIGAGTTLGGGNARGARRGGTDAMWTRSIGLQGGWSLVSATDVADIAVFALPFAGSSALAGSLPMQGPTAVSVILPMGEKIAIEPSFDVHRIDVEGGDPVTAYSFGARANYALNRTAYAGAGLNYSTIDADGIDDGSNLAWLIAAGLRFPIVGALSGRTELNYRVFDGSDVFPSGQATSFVFGILVPIN